MSIRSKKIQAFTLSEMLVVLLLTIVVVGLAFSILGLVQKQMFGIQENYEEKTAENLLRQAVWDDFNSYGQVHFDQNNGSLLLENELEQKQYGFYETFITRDLDTFYTDIRPQKLYFEGEEVLGGTIDAIELSNGEEKGNNKQIFVCKKNSASEFMD